MFYYFAVYKLYDCLLSGVRLSAQACPFSGQYSVVSGDVAAALPSLPTPSQPNHAKCPSLGMHILNMEVYCNLFISLHFHLVMYCRFI